MSTNSPAVKIGQVWTRKNGLARFQIVDLDPNQDIDMVRVYAKELSGGLQKSFGWIRKTDNTPINWEDGWYVEKEPTTKESATVSTEDALTAFFKKVPDGYCPCNILRSQCSYHHAS